MAQGVRRVGKVSFVDKGAHSMEDPYTRFNFVVDEDSCYLSLQDNNVGHPLTDKAWWKCIANGKPATEAAKKAIVAINDAIKATERTIAAIDDAGRATSRATSSALAADQSSKNANAATDAVLQTNQEVRNVMNEVADKITELSRLEQALASRALLAPTDVKIDYLKRISLRNVAKLKIAVSLLPAYVLQNVIFHQHYLYKGDAVTVDVMGNITINKIGRSVVDIIPTNNTALTKTIEIEVVPPRLIKTSKGFRFTGKGKLRLF